MTDFAFKIVGDASGALRSEQQVIDGLEDIKRQAAQAGRSMSAGFQQVVDSAGILGNKLREVGKQVTFHLAAEGLKELSTELGNTAGAALSAAGSGVAMGSAFGGPFGAAIGGAIGLVKGLASGVLAAEAAAEKERKAIEAQGKAYWDLVHAIERKKLIETGLADVTRQIAEYEKQRAEQLATTNRIVDGSAASYRQLTDEISAYQAKLVNAKEAFRTDPSDRTQADVASAERALRDAQTELELSTKSYGQTLAPILKAENERKDRIADLEQILGRENLTQEASKRVLDELNTLYRAGGRTIEEYNKQLAEKQRLQKEEEERQRRLLQGDLDALQRGTTGIGDDKGLEGVKKKADELPGVLKELQENIRKGLKEQEDEQKERTEKLQKAMTDSWHERLKAAQEVTAAQGQLMAEAISPVKDALVDAALTGEMSFSRMFESIEGKLANLAADFLFQQLISAATGAPDTSLIGRATGSLPGHATGDQWTIGGSGGTDSQLVAFRGSPGERVTVETPEQQRNGAMLGGGASSVRIINRYEDDPRAVRQSLSGRDGERTIYNTMRRTSPRRQRRR